MDEKDKIKQAYQQNISKEDKAKFDGIAQKGESVDSSKQVSPTATSGIQKNTGDGRARGRALEKDTKGKDAVRQQRQPNSPMMQRTKQQAQQNQATPKAPEQAQAKQPPQPKTNTAGSNQPQSKKPNSPQMQQTKKDAQQNQNQPKPPPPTKAPEKDNVR